MKGIFSIFSKDERAFTGLESAIVLTAFVVVAAVFSYVVLGAGFATSDTAKATIDEGVKQATSSIQLAGDVFANSNDSSTISYIILTVQLTAGQAPVDIGANSSSRMLVASYYDEDSYNPELNWTKNFVGDNDGDDILEQHEKVQINIEAPPGSSIANASTAANTEFTVEIKPKVGAVLPVTRTIPPDIDTYMRLV